MNKLYYSPISALFLALFFCVCLIMAPAGSFADESAFGNSQSLEEQGIDPVTDAITSNETPGEYQVPMLDSLPDREVLLVPNSTQQSIGIYETFDGAFIGNFVVDSALFTTPICAIAGPDSNIYLSDQVADAVFVYNKQGEFLFTYADATDGLDNIRGIAFWEGNLFVTSGNDYVARFDGPHNRIADFFSSGADPFDIFFLDDGRALVADITGDDMKLYNADGTFVQDLFTVDFPEQINFDLIDENSWLNSSFADDQVRDFDLDGNISESTPWAGGRGVYRLDNGNFLLTSATGVYEVAPGSGSIVDQKNTGSGRFVELYRPPLPGGTSDIDVNPTSIVDTLEENGSVNRSLYISNLGTAMLYYGLHDNAAWITVSPDTGNVPVSQTDTINVLLNAAGLAPGSYSAQISINSNDPDELLVVQVPVSLEIVGPAGCQYVPGDINGNGAANGIDVTFGVAYFKGGTQPPIDCGTPVGPCPQASPFFAAGDVNGNCAFNGIDITFFVSYLKGGQPALLYCPDCPPAR
jgi:hypothetical protein